MDRGYRVAMATRIRICPTLGYREWWSPIIIAGVLYLLSQNWSGLDTPDSEFYASLAIYTDQVTDRAPFDGYFWTRLGMIAPAHTLISLLGIWEGFAVYKLLLLTIFTVSLFAIGRRFIGFWRATWLAAATGCSSIVIAYFGNPYVSATVLAGLAALMAFAIRDGHACAVGGGITLGWLAMTYPTGALLGAVIWVSIRTYRHRIHRSDGARPVVSMALTGGALATTATVFWFAGRLMFPSLDWWQTFTEASAQDHAVLGSGEWVWLRDISLLVPAATLVLSVLNRPRAQTKEAADLAIIVSSSSVAFYLAFAPIFGAQFLEAPLHQVLLWGPTLAAIVLVAASRMPEMAPRSLPRIALALAVLVIVLTAGRAAPGMSLAVGIAVAVAMTAVILVSPQRTVATIIAVGIFLTGAQLLQNSRPQLGNFMLDPYYWAYTSNPNEEKLRTAVNAQQWLLDNTSSDDRLLLWVDGPWFEGDRELYSVAAMQLWGENRVTLEPTLTDDYGLQKIADVKPTALVLYGKSMDAVWAFWQSIPRELDPAPPQCYDFSWPIDPTAQFPTSVGHSCLVRLTKE